jgi:hypothetical protein
MPVLGEMAQLVRSKNAGPFWMTIDVMFDSADAYETVKRSGAITEATMARALKRDSHDLIITMHDAALAVKISYPRDFSSGAPCDSDVFGGQQYAGVLDLEIPDWSPAQAVSLAEHD